MENITARRSLKQYEEDETGSLEGKQLLSFETTGRDEQDTLAYIEDNFASFLTFLEHLRLRDRELVLHYYLLHKTQEQLAPLHRCTQTVASFQLRAAIRTLSAIMLFGNQNPDANMMEPILARMGYAHPALLNTHGDRVPVNFAVLMAEYHECRSFSQVADKHSLHRPEIRRTISRVGQSLRDSDRRREQALGWWMYNLIDKVSASTTGYSVRQTRKQGDIYITLPPITGEFYIDVTDPNFDQVFAARAAH